MLLIMTDEELMERKRFLTRQKQELEAKLQMMNDQLDELYIIWRSEKNPKVKREIHHKIYKLKDQITFSPYNKDIHYIMCEIREINDMLYPNQRRAGYFYEDDRELDFNVIELYGIHGCKL